MKHRRRILGISLVTVPVVLGALVWTWSEPQARAQLAAVAARFVPAPRATEMAPMRDGAKLATTVFLPFGAGPDKKVPVLLERTPYGRKTSAGGNERLITLGGVAFVSQDLRGRGDSEGAMNLFESDGWGELQDGVDTLKWLREQTWCNGTILTQGGSALGITQVQLASSAPEGLTACYISVAASNLYEQALYQGGVLRKSQAEGWTMKNRFPPEVLKRVVDNPFDNELWRSINAELRFEKVNVPAVHIGGWFDTFSQGTLNTWKGWNEKGLPRARGHQYLIMGPWTHGAWKKTKQGQQQFPAHATRDMNPLKGNAFKPSLQQWLSRWAGGKEDALKGIPKAQYYLMGSDEPDAPGHEWKSGDSWPPTAASQRWYLGGEGSGPDTGSLSQSAPEKPATASFTHDPAKPLRTRGGNNLLLDNGPHDQRPVYEAAPQGSFARFSSAPLSAPLSVIGPVKATLSLSSTAQDVDVSVRLVDVYPDGREMLILDGVQRASLRDGFLAPNPLQPDAPVTLTVDLWSTAYVFAPKHRVQVVVCGSNYPRFDAQPLASTNTLRLGGEQPCFLALPVLDETRAKGAAGDGDGTGGDEF